MMYDGSILSIGLIRALRWLNRAYRSALIACKCSYLSAVQKRQGVGALVGSARKRRRGGENDVDDDGDDGGVQALENAKRM